MVGSVEVVLGGFAVSHCYIMDTVHRFGLVFNVLIHVYGCKNR